MKQNTWAKNLGLAALWLCVLVIISTVVFTYFGYLLPSHIHTDVAVPIMLLIWFSVMPISFGLAIAACTAIEGRSLGIKTFVGHVIFWIIILGKLFGKF